MSVKDSVTDIGGKIMSRSHKLLLKVSGGASLSPACRHSAFTWQSPQTSLAGVKSSPCDGNHGDLYRAPITADGGPL